MLLLPPEDLDRDSINVGVVTAFVVPGDATFSRDVVDGACCQFIAEEDLLLPLLRLLLDVVPGGSGKNICFFVESFAYSGSYTFRPGDRPRLPTTLLAEGGSGAL